MRGLFRRLLKAERRDPGLRWTVHGVPWAPSGGDADPHVAANLDPVVPSDQLPPDPVPPAPVPRSGE